MLFAKSLNCIRHKGSSSFDTFEKHTRTNEAALTVYTTGGGGGGGQRIFLGGLKNFVREKWGLVKISEGRKGECQFF